MSETFSSVIHLTDKTELKRQRDALYEALKETLNLLELLEGDSDDEVAVAVIQQAHAAMDMVEK